MLEALVELVAEHAPLVLLLDDLQSADPATIGALSYLRHRCSDVPRRDRRDGRRRAAAAIIRRTGSSPTCVVRLGR